MTKIFFAFAGLCLVATLQYCTPGNAEQTTDSEADKAAILKAIDTESRMFYKKDHAAWSNSYVHSPKVHWVCVEEGVTLRANGWDDLSQFVQTWMKDNPQPLDYEKANFTNKNVQVTINGDMAFVSMEASNIQPEGAVRHTIGSRTMVKENGTWKILSMTSYPSDLPKGSTPNVYVHQAE